MSRKTKTTSVSGRRDVLTPIATRSVPVRPQQTTPRLVYRHQLNLPFTEIEDNRTYHPDPVRQPRTILSGKASIIRRLTPQETLMYSPPAFAAPQNVLVCVRRKARKQVMHALNHAGRSGQKRPKRNFNSSISCKG